MEDGSPNERALPESSIAGAGGGVGDGPRSALQRLVEYGCSEDELIRFAVPHREVVARLRKGRNIELSESDAERVLKIFIHADEVFGDRRKAQRWLREPCRAIGGVVPLSLLQSNEGSEIVREELVRIEYGIYV